MVNHKIKNGYRITKNGVLMKTIEKEAIKETSYKGQTLKVNGDYYYFNRKQGDIYVYLQ